MVLVVSATIFGVHDSNLAGPPPRGAPSGKASYAPNEKPSTARSCLCVPIIPPNPNLAARV